MIRVLVADDHDVVRFGLTSLLAGEPDMTLVAAVGDGLQAAELALDQHPDVVLMDLSMPVMDGFSAMRRIRREAPGVRILALTTHSRDAVIQRAFAAGADGYLLKESTSTEILDAIRAVHVAEV